VILLILFVYGLYAATFFAFSRFGFFLSLNQLIFLILSFCVVAAYNLCYQNASWRLSRFRYADYLQVFLDMLLVTVLIHFSGGAASWVWTLYLIVTIEAVYLLKRSLEVALFWSVGSILYGTLLICEHTEVICTVPMPFVDPLLVNDHIYLLLIWFWVAILNAAVSAIGFHLMSVSRGETQKLKESREQLFAFLEHAEDLIQLNAPDGSFIYANRAWLKAMGYQQGDLATLKLWELVHPDCRGFSEQFNRVATAGETGTIDARFMKNEGKLINVEGNLSCSMRGGEVEAIWGICRDVTLKKQADQELYRRAHHDVLTDLPNRQLFMDRLQQLRGMMIRMGRQLAVFYLDLDRFKSVNDTLGHGVGDKLLQEVARRLTASVRETDTVARLGGDEFVIALGNIRNRKAAEHVAAKVLNSLSLPCLIDGYELLITSSIGICMHPDDATDLDELVEKADRALYLAKQQGRGCYRMYCDVVREEQGAAGSATPCAEARSLTGEAG
jgi:diguanylate cyclase (GGDEF)-like protein/PAS domain S-box-containing protein